MNRIISTSILFVMILIGSRHCAIAQTDVKFNFVGSILQYHALEAEIILSEDFSLDFEASFSEYFGVSFCPAVRAYFAPDDDAEGKFAMPYIRLASEVGVAGGVCIGRKYVAMAGFVFEYYIGIGKYVGGGIDFRGAVNIGWRFGG
jgi:hypothetical protein